MKRIVYLIAGTMLLLVSCHQQIKEPEMNDTSESEEIEHLFVHAQADELEVELINEDGVGVGIATLKEVDDGVHITIDAHHLQPGIHGFHIHERGLCELPNFESAGGHFNPTNKKHGFDHPEGYHAGDLENINVNEDGTVKQTVINKDVTLNKDEVNSLLQKEGTSLVIHADPDDYVSQPAGNAGDRIACGVIKPLQGKEKSK